MSIYLSLILYKFTQVNPNLKAAGRNTDRNTQTNINHKTLTLFVWRRSETVVNKETANPLLQCS